MAITTFQIKLEKQVNSPKNWPCTALLGQITGNYALVAKKNDSNLWDLYQAKIVPGLWTGLHPYKNLGIGRSVRLGENILELRDIESGKVITKFEEDTCMELDPYGPFATCPLSQDYDDQADNLRSGQKKRLSIYNTESGKRLYELQIPHVLGVFLPHNRFASVDSLGKILIYDLATGSLMKKLKGFARRPLFIRTDSTGQKMFIYGVNWKKNEAVYQVWDVENFTLITEQSGEYIRFGKHVSFYDGVHIIGDVAILNTKKNTLHDLWLGIYYNAPHVTALKPLFEWPFFAIIVCRDKSGIKEDLEIWDVLERKRLGSIELGVRADAIIPMKENKIAVLHSLDGGRPIFDDKDDPALSIYSLHKKSVSKFPLQPEPGSIIFRKE